MSSESPDKSATRLGAPTDDAVVTARAVSPSDSTKTEHPLTPEIKADVLALNAAIEENREMRANFKNQKLENLPELMYKASFYDSCIIVSKATFLNSIRYLYYLEYVS